MKEFNTKDIRNICLLGHSSSGKTTLAEAMIFNAGYTDRIGNVLNKEYSPEFQFELYELSIQDLMEPIIDIGCGSQAEFINVLLQKEKDAFGIDRLLKDQNERLIEISWLEYRFLPESWGTIYSNMAFSNHYIYALRDNPSDIIKYALKFEEILESLKINGSFIYAPSLQEIENKVDKKKYEVMHIWKASGVTITKIKKIAM